MAFPVFEIEVIDFKGGQKGVETPVFFCKPIGRAALMEEKVPAGPASIAFPI